MTSSNGIIPRESRGGHASAVNRRVSVYVPLRLRSRHVLDVYMYYMYHTRWPSGVEVFFFCFFNATASQQKTFFKNNALIVTVELALLKIFIFYIVFIPLFI